MNGGKVTSESGLSSVSQTVIGSLYIKLIIVQTSATVAGTFSFDPSVKQNVAADIVADKLI